MTTVENILQGERFVFPDEDDSKDAFTFDFYVAPKGGIPDEHIHATQSEVFACKKGSLRVIVGGKERVLQPGDEVEIPAGTAHAFTNPSTTDECHCVVTYRPPGRNRAWLELIAAHVKRHGTAPGILDLAPFIGDVDIYLAAMPIGVQRPLYALLKLVAVALGRKKKMLASARETYGRPFDW